MARQFPIARVGALCVGAALLAQGGSCAAAALGQRRNVYGNAALEDRLGECAVPGSDAVARLYRGNAGATVAFWYSVTLEHRGGGGRERQFWYSYAAPWVDSIACRPRAVVLFAHEAAGRPVTSEFALAAIDSSLAPRPLVYTNGSPQRVSRAGGPRPGSGAGAALALGFGGGLVVTGAALVLWAVAPRRRRPPPEPA